MRLSIIAAVLSLLASSLVAGDASAAPPAAALSPASAIADNHDVPCIVMKAGHAGEFKLRHGEPATPERIATGIRMRLDARRDGLCEGVVTYCLEKSPGSRIFDLARDLFREFPAAYRSVHHTLFASRRIGCGCPPKNSSTASFTPG